MQSKFDSKFSTQWNQQLSVYVFSKVIECLEQNIWKQIDCKRPFNIKKMNWVQHTQIKMRKYKAVKCFEIKPGKVSSCSFTSS